MVAGFVWPITLEVMAAPPPHRAEVYLHFLTSLAICGLAAAAYPYFVVTFLAVRVLYPSHLGPDGPAAADKAGLWRIGRELGFYQAIATAVPLAAVGLLVWRGTFDAFAFTVLIVTGLVSIGVAYLLVGRIRADLAAPSEAAEPLAATD